MEAGGAGGVHGGARSEQRWTECVLVLAESSIWSGQDFVDLPDRIDPRSDQPMMGGGGEDARPVVRSVAVKVVHLMLRPLPPVDALVAEPVV